MKYSKVPSLSRTVLLSGVIGSELFMSKMLRSISDELNVNLIEIDFKYLNRLSEKQSKMRDLKNKSNRWMGESCAPNIYRIAFL